jgi:hypothetical protein
MTSGTSDWLILKALRWAMFGLLVALLSVMSGVVGFRIGGGGEDGAGTGPTSPAQGEADFSILDEIYGIIGEDFVAQDSVDPEMLRQGAIDGALSALGDPHTIYIDPETYALGIDIVTGQFEGIGARVEQDRRCGPDGRWRIHRRLDSGPGGSPYSRASGHRRDPGRASRNR